MTAFLPCVDDNTCVPTPLRLFYRPKGATAEEGTDGEPRDWVASRRYRRRLYKFYQEKVRTFYDVIPIDFTTAVIWLATSLT